MDKKSKYNNASKTIFANNELVNYLYNFHMHPCFSFLLTFQSHYRDNYNENNNHFESIFYNGSDCLNSKISVINKRHNDVIHYY